MSSKDKLILSVKHRSEPIEYRPHIHHRLHVHDDTFDLKFSALLWCQTLVKELKNKCFDKFSERYANKLIDHLLDVAMEPVRQPTSVPVIQIKSGECNLHLTWSRTHSLTSR
jgi:hypothetical protein